MKIKNETLNKVILRHLKKYPQSMPQDIVKLVYQSVMGAGHNLKSKQESRQSIINEAQTCAAHRSVLEVEKLYGDMYRVYLCRGADTAMLCALNDLFYLTAKNKNSNLETLKKTLSGLKFDLFYASARFTRRDMAEYVSKYIAAGCPVCSHSEIYKTLYSPNYRIVDKKYLNLFDLFYKTEASIEENKKTVIAIDGMCGAGKTTAAELVKECFGGDIVHADDFFLPRKMRTAERLNEPGGNFDYERFNAEVSEKLTRRESFVYKAYSCKTDSLEKDIEINADSPVTVVEGSYCLSPKITAQYDLRFFCEVSAETQLERIKAREGAAALKIFKEKWIPLENRYFEEYKIKNSCDAVLKTDV